MAEADPELSAQLAHELTLPPALARVLVNRGFRTVEAAQRFLRPQLRDLNDPFALSGMEAAVARVWRAIQSREQIVIYGDYDVDGVTSSALLVWVLRAAGGLVENFLPHRVDEGYGLSADGLARCLRERQPQLLIAVDCGTSSCREIAMLAEQGIDTIVLDHHEAPAELPRCVALVNPKVGQASSLPVAEPRKLEACATGTTPLCSVGVAFKLAHALLKRERALAERIDLREHLDLVALGTVADVVPLTGENRILVKAGLARLPQTRKIGLRALLDVAAVRGAVSPYHVGFRLGPRLNAAGRIGDAMAALELLLTENPARAAELAKQLNEHNAERQRIEERIVQEALAQARGFAATDRVLVLADENWHVGVIGIVASRVLQEFYGPTVVIGAGGKGSCRSVTGFSIVAALRECAAVLEKFGGHEMAAGLTIQPARVAELRRALNAYAVTALKDEDLLRRVHVDAAVTLPELDETFLARLAEFEPCGQDNPAPVFAAYGVVVRGEPRVVGRKHLRFQVTDGTATLGAIWWNHADEKLPRGPLALAFVPELNDYNGERTLQLRVRDVVAASG